MEESDTVGDLGQNTFGKGSLERLIFDKPTNRERKKSTSRSKNANRRKKSSVSTSSINKSLDRREAKKGRQQNRMAP